MVNMEIALKKSKASIFPFTVSHMILDVIYYLTYHNYYVTI